MIIYLYGPDTFRSRQKLNELKEKFQKDVDPTGANIKTIDGEKMVLDELSSSYSSGSLFAKRRMLIVENVFYNKSKSVIDEVASFLEQNERRNSGNGLNDDNIIIFLDDEDIEKQSKNKLKNFLLRQKFVQPFLPLSLPNLNAWVLDKMKSEGCVIRMTEASRITGMYGNNLWMIDNELKKLAAYKKGKIGRLVEGGVAMIENEDLSILSPGKIDENIFALTDAMANRDRAKALELLENEIGAGKADIYILNMITRQFKIILQIRQALDAGHSHKKISTDLKIHPYVLQKSMRQAKNFSFEMLESIFEKLVDLDMGIKTGKSEFKISIDLLISTL